ncbi:MAG: GWxTD domain-containing protein [Gemmatimonadaceae bacterium]
MGRVGRVAWCALIVVMTLSLAGCGTRGARGGSTAQRAPQPARAQAATLGALDPTEAYRRAGFLTTSGPVSFVGSVHFLAGPAPDSVLAVVAVSLPSRSLTFTREGERYRAAYEVEFELLRRAGGTARAVGRFKARETVRVSHLRETTRDEESVIFQQVLVVPPGNYTAALTVRDLGSNRSGTAEVSTAAPHFASAPEGGGASVSALAPPVTVYTATPRASRFVLPDFVVSARSAAIFGRDSVIRVYFEWYGVGGARPGDRPPLLRFSVRSDDGRELHADSVIAGAWGADGQLAAATARVPVAKVGLGRLRLTAWHAGGIDTVAAPIFVSAAEDIAAVSFEEMLGYLRYFATAERLRTLRDAAPETRAAAWTAFLTATDPSPATSEHEGLREYFGRLAVANARFRGEEVPGWLSDRGMVYSTLGEPDRVAEPRTSDARARGRAQLWEYTQHRLRLVFIEQDSTRRWRLTPASEAEFQAVAERVKR